MSTPSVPSSPVLALAWLPEQEDFRKALRAAREVASESDRVTALSALAGHRLDFLQTIQVDRAMGDFTGAVDGFARARLAILGSSTLDHLAGAVRVAGLRRRLLIDVHVGGYGQYRQEILERSSAFHRFAPDTVLLSLTARETLTGVSASSSDAEVEDAVQAAVGQLRELWRLARQSVKATVLQQTFLNLGESLFGSYDRMVPGTTASLVDRLNERLAAAAREEGVHLVDLARASAREGLDAWFDRGRWLQGKYEVAPQAAPAFGELIVRVIAALRGRSYKCLVLDLDNTLWGGVIGDDGIEGIVLGEGSAAGEAHLALQHYAKELSQRGVILAVCSKNDPATAEAVFRDHPEMVLKRTDIAAFVANWDDKAANLRRVAEILNIGIDSLVFMDDNPIERARIRQSLPLVAVPELTADPADYVRLLAAAGYFEAVSFTVEDRQRSTEYAANVSREALLKGAESLDQFLQSLEMSLEYGPFNPADLPRVVQLINKTNQFNPTTRRYSAEEVGALARANEAITLQFRLRDRFGDNGLVSVMILRPVSGEDGLLDVDTWVMSCRVFGRELECEAMNLAVATARASGYRALRADYLPTAKNGVVRELYPSLGFRPAEQDGLREGSTRWQLNLAEYTHRPTHIRHQGEMP